MKLKEKHNILLFVVDEQRYPPIYETAELRKWKKKNLKFQTELSKKGTVFHNHYTNSTACCPARGTLHTGQYPSVHGVTQTDGIAIAATDPEMTWMPKFTVPTIGNYLEEIGYKSIIKGKWHVSDANIYTNNGMVINTFNNDGVPIPELEKFYLEKDILSDYGYHGFIGPEPHGKMALNSGSSVPPPQRGRDAGYVSQLITELDKLNRCSCPWFLNATFVNPHDIALFGLYTNLPGQDDNFYFEIDPTLPEKLFTDDFNASHSESLDTKPIAQTQYRNLYHTILQPIPPHLLDKYYRCYYTLQKIVDNDMYAVWQKLISLECYSNTIILFVSDHGELLSSHGNMHQKWYNAYQESIHVPFIISSPIFCNKHQDVYSITSHIDIFPTILAFAGLDTKNKIDKIRCKLSEKFSMALPNHGTNLCKYIKGHIPKSSPIFYFFTEDQPDNGPNQVNALCIKYNHVPQPCNLDAIILEYQNKLWKLTRYYNKNGRCDTSTCSTKCNNIPGELYNMTDDLTEINNLIFNPQYTKIVELFQNILIEKSFSFRGERGSRFLS